MSDHEAEEEWKKVVSTESIIRPILTKTYGDNGMSRALVIYLADKINKYDSKVDDRYERSREHSVMLTCWNWFPGGTTAEAVAREIEAALKASEEGVEVHCEVCGASSGGRCDPPEEYEGECPYGCSPER